MKDLRRFLEGFKGEKTAVAYSGGVDSSLVAFYTRDFADAVFVKTEFTPARIAREASCFAEKFGLRFKAVEANILKGAENNPADRCRLCKEKIFEKIRSLGYDVILDGTNADDLGEDRPGLTANEKYGVVSPLAELCIGKNEVRRLMKDVDPEVSEKPSETCLATRIPFGSKITKERLARIDAAEDLLRSHGFSVLRVRDHFPVARLQLSEKEMSKALDEKEKIASGLRGLGYEHVTLDLEALR